VTGAGRGRDAVVDVLRGACVVSMVLSHLAGGSGLSMAVHSPRWVNGATGFVLLSGLVIGMVQRHVDEATGLRKLARRARLVYVAQVGLVVLALALAPLREGPAARPSLPTAEQAGGWPVALWHALTLQLTPPMIDVLSLYVALFVVAAAVLALLRRRLVGIALATSAVVWLAAVVSAGPGRETGFNPWAWQALFVSGLVAGWHWHSWSLSPVTRRRLWLCAVITAGLFLVLAQLRGARGGQGGSELVETLTARRDLGPVRLLLGWVYLAALYPVLRRAWHRAPVRWARTVLDPVGRRSLDSFVLMTVVLVVLPTIWPYDHRGWAGVVVAAATLGTAWTWARWRDRRNRRETLRGRPASAAAPSAANGSEVSVLQGVPARPAPRMG
jgi:hypothetical protein